MGKCQKKESEAFSMSTGKRKRPYGESLRIAYESISFAPLQSTSHPRSPHRFFKESYVVTAPTTTSKLPSDSDNCSLADSVQLSQVVHHHVNGLCVVTAGQYLPDKSTVAGIECVAKEFPSCSAAEKRKRQVKMLKGIKVDDAVTPTTIIAILKLKSGETLPLYACVWGMMLEVNHSLTLDVLFDDPLLDGYLAVILPSGIFPPKEKSVAGSDTI